jgi:signal peptidase I
MSPTVTDGQRVLVNKACYARVPSSMPPPWLPVLGGSGSAHYPFHPPTRGDIIVFHPPPPKDPRSDFIKRVIGVPGDTVDIGQGHVVVSGAELNEPYIHQASLPINSRFTHLTLAPDQFFVLGDNRGNSSDSSSWGAVVGEDIVGCVE